MPTLLQTGFEPFHTHPDNPSARAAQALEGVEMGGMQVVSALLPVDPHSAGEALEALLELDALARESAEVCTRGMAA